MPELLRIPPSARRHTRWKNGLGTSEEIAVFPPGAEHFGWRLSVAHIDRSSPFSAFPGYDRHLLILDGDGIELALPTQAPARLERKLEPFFFSGDVAADCSLLGGPVRDLSLLVDRAEWSGSLRVVRAPARERLSSAHGGAVVFCIDTPLSVLAAGASLATRPGEAIVSTSGADWLIDGPGTAVLIALEPRL